jgi:hypothetical protein
MFGSLGKEAKLRTSRINSIYGLESQPRPFKSPNGHLEIRHIVQFPITTSEHIYPK